MDVNSETSDMDDYQEASSEAEGMPPRLHLLSDPTTAINVPVTQVRWNSCMLTLQSMMLLEAM